MAIRLILIAHAPTAATRAAAFPAAMPGDPPPDPAGHAAAVAAARPRRVDHVRAAPERRTRETATLLGLDATTDPALRDLDHGRWAGLEWDAVVAAQPEAAGRWLTDPAATPHGGESILQLIARITEWLGSLPTGRIVAVTHPAVIRAAVVSALGAPPATFWRIDVPPLGRVRLRGHAGRWTLELGRDGASAAV